MDYVVTKMAVSSSLSVSLSLFLSLSHMLHLCASLNSVLMKELNLGIKEVARNLSIHVVSENLVMCIFMH
jgi:hypothetical protein